MKTLLLVFLVSCSAAGVDAPSGAMAEHSPAPGGATGTGGAMAEHSPAPGGVTGAPTAGTGGAMAEPSPAPGGATGAPTAGTGGTTGGATGGATGAPTAGTGGTTGGATGAPTAGTGGTIPDPIECYPQKGCEARDGFVDYRLPRAEDDHPCVYEWRYCFPYAMHPDYYADPPIDCFYALPDRSVQYCVTDWYVPPA